MEVYEKNSADAGDGVAATGSITRTATGTETLEFSGCKEFVRFKFTVTGTGATYALFRMLDDVWYDAGHT